MDATGRMEGGGEDATGRMVEVAGGGGGGGGGDASKERSRGLG